MCCAWAINSQSSELHYFRFPQSATFELLHLKWCPVLGADRMNCTCCLLQNISAPNEKNKRWREAVLLFTQQSSVWPGAGGPARPCARMGMLLRCREREVHTVFCYRLPTAQPWKAEMQRHENVICENQHVITASLFSAGNFGWQVLSEDNVHVSYLCYFSTHAKITQTLVSFGKNTSQHNACQCVLNCMLHN